MWAGKSAGRDGPDRQACVWPVPAPLPESSTHATFCRAGNEYEHAAVVSVQGDQPTSVDSDAASAADPFSRSIFCPAGERGGRRPTCVPFSLAGRCAADPNSLPRDAETLRKIVVDLAEQLDRSLVEQNKYQSLLRELLEAQRNRKSEQLSKEQLALFEAAWKARSPKTNPLPARATMTSMAMRERGQNRTKSKVRNGVGAKLWHGI